MLSKPVFLAQVFWFAPQKSSVDIKAVMKREKRERGAAFQSFGKGDRSG